MTKRATAAAPDAAPKEPELQPEESTLSETHTYADGSAVVGRPPWPEKSPLERAREAAEGKAEA